MPRPRKRRKIERPERTTRYLDLTEDTAQSDYDRKDSTEVLMHALRHRRKIVVIAGAGISVSAGIPDFRSANGLFAGLQKEHKLKGGSGKQLFDASVYKDGESTSQFHDMVRKLDRMSKRAKPTAFHRMVARLSKENRLLRLYTQNVDGLESQLPPLQTETPLPHKAPWPQTIQLHGGLDKMMCQKCRTVMDFDAALFEGEETPTCPECRQTDDYRTNELGRRSHGIGKLRPRIVLYNEQNPDESAIGAVSAADMRTRPDAIVVVGTSMKIPGVRRIVSEMCKIVRDRREGTTIWVNPDPEPTGPLFEGCWDLIVKGTSDDVATLVRLRQWDDTNMDDPDAPTEYTDSDVERINARQGQLRIDLPPSPVKKLAKPAASVLTPPRSRNGESPAVDISTDNSAAKGVLLGSSPLRITLKVGEKSAKAEAELKKQQTQVQVIVPPLKRSNSAAQVDKAVSKQRSKNPASSGKKIADVLGKEAVSNNRKSKTSLPKSKVKKEPGAKQQSKLAGKVTKSGMATTSVKPSKDDRPVESLFKSGAPIRPDSDYRRWIQPQSNDNLMVMSSGGLPSYLSKDVQQVPTPDMTSSGTTPQLTPDPQTPRATDTVPYDRHATESPKGAIPNGMADLLH